MVVISEQDGFRMLAESVIELAAKDLNSKNWRDQHSAILFFGEDAPSARANEDDVEYFDVVCALADTHPDVVLDRMPEFTPLPLPENRAPDNVRDRKGYVGSSSKQLFDVWDSEEFKYSVEGRRAIAKRLGVSVSTIDGMIKSGTPNIDGIAIVKKGGKPVWPQKYTVYKNGRKVGSVYGIGMAARLMETVVKRAKEALESGEATGKGYQIVLFGQEPAVSGQRCDARAVKVYKDREFLAVVKNNIHAAQIAKVSSATVCSCKASGRATGGGYTFKAVNG